MKEFNRQNLVKLRSDFETMIKKFCADNSIPESKMGNIKFYPTSSKFTIELNLSSDDMLNKARREWNVYAVVYGFANADFGRKFITNTGTYTISGIHINRPKYPITAMRSDGKLYKFDVNVVKRALNK